MVSGASRERTGCELVFGILKTLMVSYSLWGTSSGLEPSHLSDALHTSEPDMDGILDYLSGEGLISIDPATGRVRLTDHAARDLLLLLTFVPSPGLRSFAPGKRHRLHPVVVVFRPATWH